MNGLLAAAAVALAGAGLVALAFPERAGDLRGRALRACLGLLLGLGAWSAAFAAALLLFGRDARIVAAKDALLAAAGAVLVVLRRGRPVEAGAPGDPAPRGVWALLALGCVVCTGAMIEHTLHWPDGGYDAWMIWNLRARFLVRARDFHDAFSPHLLYWVHQDYPWLLPGVVAQGALLRQGDATLVAEVVSYLFGVLAVATLALSLARLRGPLWGLLGGLALLGTPCFSVFIANQQSDIPLAAYMAAAAALLAMAVADPRRPATLFLLSGFAAGLGAWTKNEGILYAGCLFAALQWKLRQAREPLWFALGFMPLGALVLGFKLTVALPNDLLRFSSAAGLLQRASDLRRWGELLLLVLRRLVFFQNFALWLVAEVLLLLLVLRSKRPGALGLALLLAFAAYLPIYLLQPHPLDWLFRTSIDRIVIQLWPAVILANLLALAPARTTART
ncbi:MAG TPA: glycosyltransferase family 39 protein [Myxococcales bacterium]|nr:glycosyltransferase family 39 protein [Myxococcales bacterium]